MLAFSLYGGYYMVYAGNATYLVVFRDRVIIRIPILRPNKKAHPKGGLSYLDGYWDSKDRPERSEGKKQSGGLFLRSWENPFLAERIP